MNRRVDLAATDVFAAVFALEFHRQAVAWMEVHDTRKRRDGRDELAAAYVVLPGGVVAAIGDRARELAELAIERLTTPTVCLCFSQGWANHKPTCPNRRQE